MPQTLKNASSRYGADMGRPDHISEPDAPIKFHLRYMPFVDGDYDKGGAYWGCGEPIFHAWGDGQEEEQEMFIRASDRFHARLEVRKQFTNARFYR